MSGSPAAIKQDSSAWSPGVAWSTEVRTWTCSDALVLSHGSNPEIVREDAPGLIITRGVQDDPVQIWTKGAAVGMPVMHAPDAHIVAKAL
ncbi:hypothetical protein [Streptomyces sp. NPDC006012]|uniref:hypothetical protein n=1 Tax=Streptomyces sp. NPDC006012 TaxID=3364739 RepID=UPI0036BAC61D